jgi:hypothetical protein
MNTEERTTVQRDVTGQRVEREAIRDDGGEVRVIRESNSAAWWVAALVAIVAIAGLLWLFNSNQQNVADLEAAREAGRAEAMMDSATLQAQSAALAAQEATRSTSDSMARATEQAAVNAAAASEAAAREAQAAAASVGDAARDAAAEAPVVIETE